MTVFYRSLRPMKLYVPLFGSTGMAFHESFLLLQFSGAVPLSRETGFSPWEEGRDTTVVLLDPKYGL